CLLDTEGTMRFRPVLLNEFVCVWPEWALLFAKSRFCRLLITLSALLLSFILFSFSEFFGAGFTGRCLAATSFSFFTGSCLNKNIPRKINTSAATDPYQSQATARRLAFSGYFSLSNSQPASACSSS